jgi:hypothetical protein
VSGQGRNRERTQKPRKGRIEGKKRTKKKRKNSRGQEDVE